jgi:hypothetical protein
MLLQEIEQYVEDAGLDACAEDFLEKIPWVIYPDEWTEEHRAYIDKKIQEILETGEATTEYEPELPKVKLRSHRFKPDEWLYITKRQELVDLLKKHKAEFHINEWLVNDIEYFLHLQHWIYPQAHHQKHHIRACATIIREEGAL